MKGLRKLVFTLAILACILCMPAIVVEATAASVVASGNMGENITWTLDDEGLLVVSGTGATKDYKDPWTDHLWAVVEVDNGWLEPKKLVIKDGITGIGDYSLACLEELTSVEMADSVVVIGSHAFWNCRKLVNVKFSSNIKAVRDHAFAYCESLTSVSFPSSVSVIEKYAFFHCDALTSVSYAGSEGEWSKVSIDNAGNTNAPFVNATVHYDDTASATPSSWAKNEVSAAIADGLVPKNLQRNYTRSITRGDAISLLISLLEQSSGKSVDTLMSEKGVAINPATFTDTTDTSVLAVNALGIIKGVGNNRFNSDGTLTRSQIAVIVNRVANVLGINTDGYSHSFTDVVGHWASPELGWPSSVGIINGVGNNRFSPDTELTTEQAIVIMYRALQVLKVTA